MRRWPATLAVATLATSAVLAPRAASPADAEEAYPVAPYIDRAAQLDTPAPDRLSFYTQPWRGYQETVPAARFLAGIGINYNLPDGTDDAAVLAVLAEAGIRSIRLELGWGTVIGEDDTVRDEARSRIRRILTEARSHGIVPMILLNANQGEPVPHVTTSHVLAEPARAGDRSLVLDDTDGLVAGRSGLSHLTGYGMAEALFTGIDGDTVELGAPLPRDLAAGAELEVDTMSYAPLHPVGTPEYEATAAGWLRYVRAVLAEVRAAGVEDFEVEIWNELTFGSDFLAIENYTGGTADPEDLHPGGRVWELARRTTEQVKADHPRAKVIWGFSNTTFYEVPIAELPPGTDGQSYHPYTTGRSRFPDDIRADHRDDFDYIPEGLDVLIPEGVYQLAVTRESLIRSVLDPAKRARQRPPGTTTFDHYFTEHGVAPGELGITDPDEAMAYKAKSLLRVLPFWLNKGITKVELFAAHDEDPTGFGLLPTDLSRPGLGPPLDALRNLVRPFAGAEPLTSTRPLDAEVWSFGEQPTVFEGRGDNPPLPYRDTFTLLPFQVTGTRFVVAAYVMSFDASRPPPPMDFRVRLRGVAGDRAAVSIHDPLTDTDVPGRIVERGVESLTLDLTVVDHPRLIVLDESQPMVEPTGLPPRSLEVVDEGSGGGGRLLWVAVGAVALALASVVALVVAGRRRRARATPRTTP